MNIVNILKTLYEWMLANPTAVIATAALCVSIFTARHTVFRDRTRLRLSLFDSGDDSAAATSFRLRVTNESQSVTAFIQIVAAVDDSGVEFIPLSIQNNSLKLPLELKPKQYTDVLFGLFAIGNINPRWMRLASISAITSDGRRFDLSSSDVKNIAKKVRDILGRSVSAAVAEDIPDPDIKVLTRFQDRKSVVDETSARVLLARPAFALVKPNSDNFSDKLDLEFELIHLGGYATTIKSINLSGHYCVEIPPDATDDIVVDAENSKKSSVDQHTGRPNDAIEEKNLLQQIPSDPADSSVSLLSLMNDSSLGLNMDSGYREFSIACNFDRAIAAFFSRKSRLRCKCSVSEFEWETIRIDSSFAAAVEVETTNTGTFEFDVGSLFELSKLRSVFIRTRSRA